MIAILAITVALAAIQPPGALVQAAPIDCPFNPDTSSACVFWSNNDAIRWQREQASTAPGFDLPTHDASGNPNADDNYYAFLQFDTDKGVNTGDEAFMTLSMLASADNARCLTFYHYILGTHLANLELIRTCYDNTTMPGEAVAAVVLWRHNGGDMDADWKRETIRLYPSRQPLDQCTLAFRAAAYDSKFHGVIVLDEILTNDCSEDFTASSEAICEWENQHCRDWQATEDDTTSWADNGETVTNPIRWQIEQAKQLPSMHFDHSRHSEEGHAMVLRSNEPGCYSGRLIGHSGGFSDDRSAYCFSFYARAFKTSDDSSLISAEVYLRIANTSSSTTATSGPFLFIDSPWSARLGVSSLTNEAWTRIYANVDGSFARQLVLQAPTALKNNATFMLEARFCTTGGGGIAIDDLQSLHANGETCKITGDEDFDGFDYSWRSADISQTHNTWVPVYYANGPHQDEPNAIWQSYDIGKRRKWRHFTSRKCNDFGADTSLCLILVPTSRDQVFSYSTGGMTSTSWQLFSFPYTTKYFHKLVIEVDGGFGIDDISFTDGLCACRPNFNSFCKNSISWIKPDQSSSHWFSKEIENYYARLGDCPATVPAMLGGTYYDVGLFECEQHCSKNSMCKTFIYADAIRRCDLKSVNCPTLTATIEKTVYQRKELSKYFSQPGECTNSKPLASYVEKATPQSCADLCDANSKCAVFVYARLDKQCWLHSSACPVPTQAVDREAFELVSFANYLAYSGKCDASPKTTLLNSTRRQCAGLCDADGGCTAFSFDSSTLTCTTWLEKDCATKRKTIFSLSTYIKLGDPSVSCDFEPKTSGCNAWNFTSQTNAFDFAVTSAVDGYGRNGPRKDVTYNTNGQGNYLLASFRDNSHGDGTAQIVVQRINQNVARCLTFWYYMYGPSVGQIRVHYVATNGERANFWARQGSVVDKWVEARIRLEEVTIRSVYDIFIEVALTKSYYGGVALDDVRISQHSCLPLPAEVCTFEGFDTCSPAAKLQFALYRADEFLPGGSPVQPSGPLEPNDMTYGTQLGHFMAGQPTDDSAAILKFKHDGKHDRCLTFWYKRSSSCATLGIGLTTSPETAGHQLATYSLDYDETADDINVWTKAIAHLHAASEYNPDAYFYFHADIAKSAPAGTCTSKNSWIAIDEIVVLDHGCERKSACNFESNSCTFSAPSPSRTDVMPWLQGKAPALSRFPSPPVDNTLQDSNYGGFAIIEQVAQGDLSGTAIFTSPWLPGSGQPKALTFFYCITGPESGVLEVLFQNGDMLTKGLDPIVIWHMSVKEKTPIWNFARVSFEAFVEEHFQITFRGLRGANSYSIVAVDDIAINDGVFGSLFPLSADPSDPLSTVTPMITTPTTPYPPIVGLPTVFECSFELPSAGCGFSSEVTSGWYYACGKGCNDTTGAQTGGPVNDHTLGTAYGHYWYISLGTSTALTATSVELRKVLPIATPTAEPYYCLSFWYYSQGDNVPYVASGYRPTTAKNTYWQRAGSQGPSWQYFEYTMRTSSTNANYTLYFLSERSRFTSGYVAIDDVAVYRGECPKRDYECTFDAPTPTPVCGSTTTTDGSAKWVFPSLPSAPSTTDHTMQTNKGMMAYVSSEWTKSFTVEMSQPYPSPSTSAVYCLQFWYKMKTDSSASLTAFITQSGGVKTPLVASIESADASSFSMSQADVNLASGSGSSSTWQLSFEASFKYKGVIITRSYIIAIDDIKLLPTKCPLKNKCSFEDGLCDWQNAVERREFDWLLGAGAYGGPVATDNTFNNAEGSYVYAPYLPPRQFGDRARLLSGNFQTSSDRGCFSFYYYMTNMGAFTTTRSMLRVLARTPAGEIWLWSVDYNDLGTSWIFAQIPVDLTKYAADSSSYELVFEVSYLVREYGDTIALDDIKFNISASALASCPLTPSFALPEVASQNVASCSFSGDFCTWKTFSNISNSNNAGWAIAPADDGTVIMPAAQISTINPVGEVSYDISSFASLKSLPAKGGIGYCFQFEFQFHGEFTGLFGVFMDTTASGDATSSSIWQRRRSLGYRWHTVHLPIAANATRYDFSLSFQLQPPIGSTSTVPFWSATLAIRYAFLMMGSCSQYVQGQPSLTCDFEEGPCLWTSDTPSSLYLATEMSLPPLKPQFVDHTTETSSGHFMYAADPSGSISPAVALVGDAVAIDDQCLFFWYNAVQSSLYVQARYWNNQTQQSKDPWNPWITTEYSTDGWRSAVVPLSYQDGYDRVELKIGAQLFSSTYFAIDDVQLATGTCPHEVSCNFEDGLCSYEPEFIGSLKMAADQLTWLWTSPAASDYIEGPTTDHTYDSVSGQFIMIEATALDKLKQSRVSSRSDVMFTGRGTACVEAWYQLSGSSMQLTVSAVMATSSAQSMGNEIYVETSTSTQGAWQVLQLPFRIEQRYEFFLRVEASLLSTTAPNGYVAVDDIVYYDTSCDSLGPTTPPTTVGPIEGITCTFDNDFCSWASDSNAAYQFQRASGSVSPLYGPVGDVSGTGSYVYLASESFFGTSSNGTARLMSVSLPDNNLDNPGFCFLFWYHMTGPHIESFSVIDRVSSGTENVLWTRSMDQGNRWLQGHIELDSSMAGHSLVMQATKLSGTKGVIAFDQVVLEPGKCPSFKTCDFEDLGLCGWRNYLRDSSYTKVWSRVVAKTSNSYGPTTDHTYSSGSGAYMSYAGSDLSQTNRATLLSPEYRLAPSAENGGCLGIWLWGANFPTVPGFQVSIIPTNNGIDLFDQEVDITYIDGYSYPVWRHLSLPLKVSSTFRIAISAGFSTAGGVAIDDVLVDVENSCGEPAECSFEKGECGWNNPPANYYNWQQKRGHTDTAGTGPSGDHTIGSTGQYMYLESSVSTTFYSLTSYLESQLISTSSFPNDGLCLSFWYHMWGSKMGNLSVVNALTNGVYWTRQGDQGNQWNHGLADIGNFNSKPLVLRFRGDIKYTGQSDMAVDDTILLPGTCDHYKEPDVPQYFTCNKPKEDGSTQINLSHRCDFIPDCPDGEDEWQCGFNCDYDDESTEDCRWQAVATSKQMWLLGNGDDTAPTGQGPNTDHTANTMQGGYMYLGPNSAGTLNSNAVMRIHVQPTAETCYVSFYYKGYAAIDNLAVNLAVSIHMGDQSFDLRQESINATALNQTQTVGWRYYSVKVGRVHTDFTLSVRGLKSQSTGGYFAIDALKLENCTFAVPTSSAICTADQFKCVRSGACISSSAVCDLTDDCGDGSDEIDCSNLPVYCNFESNSCDFKLVSGSWSRTSGYTSSYYPPRDHTTGLDTGYLFNTNADSRVISRLQLSKTLYVTDKDSCRVTFYYHLSSTYAKPPTRPSLAVEIWPETGSSIELINLSDDATSWTRVEATIDAQRFKSSPFTIQFVARNVSNYVAIDDVTLTPGCLLNSQDVCLAPEYYRCKGPAGSTQPCLVASKVGDFVVDCPYGDDERGYGPCNFEPDVYGGSSDQYCGWQVSSLDDGFMLKQISSPTGFDPTSDGPPTSNPSGFIMYAKAKHLYNGEPFTFTSPALPVMSARCALTFAFYAQGLLVDEKFTLTVSYNGTSPPTVVGTQQLGTSPSWQIIRQPIYIQSLSSKAGSAILVSIEAVEGRSNATVAIDNFAFDECSASRSLPDLDCSFDDGTLCQWSEDRKIYSPQINWRFGDGSQVPTSGGPGTGFNGTGKFVFISNKLANLDVTYRAQLGSKGYEPSLDPLCLQFAYNIFGPNPGRLYLDLYTEPQSFNRELFSRVVSQGNQWRRAHVTIPTTTKRYFVMFDGWTRSSYNGYVAIDDILVSRGECPDQRTCDFENNMCSWTSDTNADPMYDFTWKRIRRYDYPHDALSGPQIDHTTESSRGFFMNFEAQTQKPGDRALLKSPPFAMPSGSITTRCLHFWYHMFGKDVGSLSLTILPTKNRRTVFSRNGNHGNHWWQANIEVNIADFSTTDLQVGNFTAFIEGVRGASAQADLAIDDAGVRNGACSPAASCDFELSECGWSNVYELNNGTSWIRTNNPVANAETGPSVDHTKGDQAGHYLVAQSASILTPGTTIYYASEIIQGSSSGYCFSFWYYLYGKDIGTLSVMLMSPTAANWTRSMLWSLSGDQGKQWKQARINIATDDEYALVFAANFTKIGTDGDVAIDDVVLDQSGPCQGMPLTSTPSPQQFYPCGFESNSCGFAAADPNSVIFWSRASGGKPVASDAPLNDRTRNDQSGHYLAGYVNSSDTGYYGRYISSLAFSDYFTTTSRHCKVSFYYQLSDRFAYNNYFYFGYTSYGSTTEKQLFYPTSAPTKGWRHFRADLGQQTSAFRLYLKYLISYVYTPPGVIAIDDLSFIDCTAPPPQQQCGSDEFQCANMACIKTDRTCDGLDDCGDGSDEALTMTCAGRIVITMEDDVLLGRYLTNVKPGENPYDPADFSWTLIRGSSGGYNTGPTFDNTYGNTTGRSFCSKAPYPGIPYNKAWLKLAPLSVSSLTGQQSCDVRFFYHMYGSNVGSINIYARTQLGGPLSLLWQRNGQHGNMWLRGNVHLNSSLATSDFELIFEAVILGIYSDIAIDDISFTEGCVFSNGQLPTAPSTSTPSTTQALPCELDPSLFSCGSGSGCINHDLVCNFVNDCPDGRDEKPPHCVNNPSTFSSTLGTDGWHAYSTTSYQWTTVYTNDIPSNCESACPTTDADSSGGYAAANAAPSKSSSERATLSPAKTFISAGPQCRLQFSYVVYSTSYASGSVEVAIISVTNPGNDTVEPTTKRTRLWTSLAGTRDWRQISIVIGQQQLPFYFEFTAAPALYYYFPAVVAIDAIKFLQCETPEPKTECTAPSDWQCKRSGACIDALELCDFADHCGDSKNGGPPSDEDTALCQTYVARCAFDEPAATCEDWFFDKGDLPWRVAQIKNTPNTGYPPVDHTLGTVNGHVLLLQYGYNQYNKVARYTTARRVVITRPTDQCAIRFYLYIFGDVSYDIGRVAIVVRTSASPLVEQVVQTLTSPYGAGAWMAVTQVINVGKDVNLNQPFEITIQGTTGSASYSSAIAVDDISLTPGCHLTDELLPGASALTSTTHAPMCSDVAGHFQCANGIGCYSTAQHCNFMNDCADASDELGCTKNYCDFDGGSNGTETDWCNWANICDGNGNCGDGLQWMWSWRNSSINAAAPKCDYTSNCAGGGYLMSSGGHSNNDRAIIRSSVFQDASPNCKLRFAYYGYVYPPGEKPTKLNVYIKTGSTRTPLFQTLAGSLAQWNTTELSVYAQGDFEVQFEVIRGTGSYGDMALDALQFLGCTPTIPAVSCVNPNDFLCSDGLKCVPMSAVCDFTTDCRDGSDEEEGFCESKRARGSCTFESADWPSTCYLNASTTADGDSGALLPAWERIDAGSILHGPIVDHTLGNRNGHVLYVDATKADFSIFETATLATSTVYPYNPTGSCLFRFNYYFYRAKQSQGSGRLKVLTVSQTGADPIAVALYSLSSIPPGTSTERNGNSWISTSVKVARADSYRILLQAELDDNALSVFAVDDISLSDGCRTGRSEPSNSTTFCFTGMVYCESEKTCLPRDWLCDGWCDCPSMTPGAKCFDESSCSSSTSATPDSQSTVTGMPTDEPQTTDASSSTPSKATTTPDGRTDKPIDPSEPDLALILGATFGAVGGVLIVVGAIVAYKFRHRLLPSGGSGAAPSVSLPNPVYGDAALSQADQSLSVVNDNFNENQSQPLVVNTSDGNSGAAGDTADASSGGGGNL